MNFHTSWHTQMYALLFVLERFDEIIIAMQVFAILAYKTLMNDFSHRFFWVFPPLTARNGHFEVFNHRAKMV